MREPYSHSPTNRMNPIHKQPAICSDVRGWPHVDGESGQVREQVMDFEDGAKAPEMMDFVGVDDLDSVLGLSG